MPVTHRCRTCWWRGVVVCVVAVAVSALSVSDRVVCVDVGSTFTKAALVDVDAGVLLARAEHRTTIEADVLDGVDACLAALGRRGRAGAGVLQRRRRPADRGGGQRGARHRRGRTPGRPVQRRHRRGGGGRGPRAGLGGRRAPRRRAAHRRHRRRQHRGRRARRPRPRGLRLDGPGGGGRQRRRRRRGERGARRRAATRWSRTSCRGSACSRPRAPAPRCARPSSTT